MDIYFARTCLAPPIIDCMMLFLVNEYAPTNNLWQVEKQHLSPQLLKINLQELATQ